MSRLQKLKTVVLCAARSWSEDRCASMGAAIAYYTSFSLAPLLLIIISVAGFFFGEDRARSALAGQIREFIGAEAAGTVETLITNTSDPSGGIISITIGILTLAFGATTVFAELQSDLDQIWKVDRAPRHGAIVDFLRTRLISFVLVIGIGFLLVMSLLLSAGISSLTTLFGERLAIHEPLFQFANFLVSFIAISVLFGAIYRVVPSAWIPWRDVWLGATVTSLLFSLGKTLIGLYLGKVAISSSFGAAGTFVVTLAWIYYASQIFLFGAELTYQTSRMNHRRVEALSPEGREPQS